MNREVQRSITTRAVLEQAQCLCIIL